MTREEMMARATAILDLMIGAALSPDDKTGVTFHPVEIEGLGQMIVLCVTTRGKGSVSSVPVVILPADSSFFLQHQEWLPEQLRSVKAQIKTIVGTPKDALEALAEKEGLTFDVPTDKLKIN